MNDDFLYDLRNNPPSEFATRLKAQLERQTVEAQRRQRAFRWSAIAAMLVGTTALAFISPSVRQATLTMVMQFRGADTATPIDPELQRLIDQKDARAEQRIMPDATVGPGRTSSEMEWSAASGRAVPDGAAFATRSERGRSTLRLGHAASLTAAAEQIAADLESRNPNLVVVLSLTSADVGVCVAGIDAWISDSRVTGSQASCRGGKRFVEVPLADKAGARDKVWLYVDEGQPAEEAVRTLRPF